MKRKTMILGLGNLLLRDEGLGVRAIERLRQDYSLPGEVEILDGGTLGISLLPYLVGISDLLIIDAVDIDQSPGTMVRLEGEAIPAALMPKISMHQVGLQELLAAGYISGELPPHIVLLGLQPENIDWGTELTATIQSALNGLVQAIMEELRERDVTPQPLS